MMKKPIKFLALAIVLALAGGAGWLAFADVHVAQQEVTKTIPNDRFFN